MMDNPLASAADLLTGVVVVTGTDTDVGKTYATAALAFAAHAAGRRRIAVYKPVQTGVLPGETGDVSDVARLLSAAGVPQDALTTAEGQRLSAPMAPPPAAAIDQVRLMTLEDHRDRIAALLRNHDLVLVEGSGGVLVELDGAGHNIADLTEHVSRGADSNAGVVLVARPDLGTLNHTLLSLEALHRRGVRVLGTVLGSWPSHPGPLHETNRDYIRNIHADDGTSVPLLGTIPEGWCAVDEAAPLKP